MTDALTALLAERDWVLLDGATGTNLFDMGLEAGEAPELWNEDAPEKVRRLHDIFIEAGSDLILTNSFGGSRYRLKLHAAEDRAYALNKRAAEIAREAADGAERTVVVAGSVGPTGEILMPVGSLDPADAQAAFEEQMRGLMDGGADVVWAETISSEEEFRAAHAAAAAVGAPFCGTLSFDTAGRSMMGVTSEAFAGIVASLDPAPIAVGANCGVGAPDLLRTVLGITGAGPALNVIAKGNAGIPKYVDGHIHYDGTPELMATYAKLARDAGARLIGGCCGSRGEHLKAMRAALEGHTPGERPELKTIEAEVGGFSSASDGTGDDSESTPRPRRRRRG